MSIPTGEQLRNIGLQRLASFYNDPHGLNRRARGLSTIEYSRDPFMLKLDDGAFFDWVTRFMQGVPIDQIEAEIRKYPEWKEQHQNETPPPPNPR